MSMPRLLGISSIAVTRDCPHLDTAQWAGPLLNIPPATGLGTPQGEVFIPGGCILQYYWMPPPLTAYLTTLCSSATVSPPQSRGVTNRSRHNHSAHTEQFRGDVYIHFSKILFLHWYFFTFFKILYILGIFLFPPSIYQKIVNVTQVFIYNRINIDW